MFSRRGYRQVSRLSQDCEFSSVKVELQMAPMTAPARSHRPSKRRVCPLPKLTLSFYAVICAIPDSVNARTTESLHVKEAKRLYWKGCLITEDQGFDPGACRQAFQHLSRAIRLDSSSPLLSFMYGSAKIELNLPNSRADGFRRVRSAIAAQPDLAQAYYYLLMRDVTSPEERIRLFRQLIQHSPKLSGAYERLIFELDIDPAKNAEAIVQTYRQYRSLEPLSKSHLNTEVDLHAANALTSASHLADAAAIYKGLMEFADHDGDPSFACTALLNVNLDDFRSLPDTYRDLTQRRRYCTGIDHYRTAGDLLDKGNLTQSAEELTLQIQTNPYYLPTFPMLAKVYLQLGRQRGALRVLQQFAQGDWSQPAKCAKLQDFGALSQYQIRGDNSVDAIRSACGKVK